MVIEGVVFDIDDTLYLERTYVRSGYRHVAASLATSADERDALTAWLLADDAAERRGDSFDRLLAAFPAAAGRASVEDLVAVYRQHPPAIALDPDATWILDRLAAAGTRIGVLSDGPVESQAAKVRALGLESRCRPIILTGRLGPAAAKPATVGFLAIADEWALAPNTLVYVADNPLKDFRGPRQLGWRTIRLRRDGQLRRDAEPASDADRPDVEIGSLRDVVRVIDHVD